jgi:AcrR family transcriptional regulator
MLIETESRTGSLVRAINDILIESGPAGLTMRNIAAMSGVNASSIYHQLGSREHLLRVAAGTTGRARTASLRVESAIDGVLAFVPRDGEEVLETRAWLGWLELWRAEDFLDRWIGESRAAERALLAEVTNYQLLRPELDALLALVDGLRVAVCAPSAPMRLDSARTILKSRCHTPAA